MHASFYNQATVELTLRPRTPLLIMSGETTDIDPSLPELQFVRTQRRKESGEKADEIYIPGSSLRGVLRSHAERLVRSVEESAACYVTQRGGVCLEKKGLKADDLKEGEAHKAYTESCYICRLFGNTGIASRVRVGDFYPEGELLTEVRHGVAIDRVTGGTVRGALFEMETVTDGKFSGSILVRNFTLGQLGLLAAALLDIGDGLVPLGHAKSRGLGRVSLVVNVATFRFAHDPEGSLKGVGALADDGAQKYDLPAREEDILDLGKEAKRDRVFFTFTEHSEGATELLERLVPFWVQQLR